MRQILYRFVLDLVLPQTCRVCGEFDTWLCGTCQGKIRLQEQQLCPVCTKASTSGATHPSCESGSVLDGLLAVGHFDQLQSLIHAYKYGLITELHVPLGQVLVRFIQDQGLSEFIKNFTVVPVPLHKSRTRFRGFNQSEILADYFSQKLNLNQEKNILFRKKNTVPQTTLDRTNRKTNIQSAFSTNPEKNLNGKKILLIDDIVTTGATLNECAKTLKKAGSKSVWALVLAHG